MAESDPQDRPVYRALHVDARRAGLVLLHDGSIDDVAVHHLADEFAQTGYETLTLNVDSMEALERGIASLQTPVVLLALDGCAALAWRAARLGAGLAAIAIHLEAGAEVFDQRPACPVILHIAHGTTGAAEGFGERMSDLHPEVRVHAYAAGSGFIFQAGDASRLARLRTLQVFAQAGGARGEV